MIVLDTHVLVWSVSGDMRLGEATRTQIETSARTGEVLVSAITPWEIALLTEKGRLRLGQDVGSWIRSALAIPGVRVGPIPQPKVGRPPITPLRYCFSRLPPRLSPATSLAP